MVRSSSCKLGCFLFGFLLFAFLFRLFTDAPGSGNIETYVNITFPEFPGGFSKKSCFVHCLSIGDLELKNMPACHNIQT